jgi:putative solute:sodium symporter small subunit
MSDFRVTKEAYWRGQKRRIAILLVVWAVTAFGLSIFLAPWLNGFSFGGVPFGFWMAQQGSIFVFVSLILIYAVTSDRADRAAGLEETDETTSGASEAH